MRSASPKAAISERSSARRSSGDDPEKSKPASAGGGSLFVAGARLRVRTPGSDSRFVSDRGSNWPLNEADFALLDFPVKMSIESLIPSAKPVEAGTHAEW